VSTPTVKGGPGRDASEVPWALVAVTVNVYVPPGVSPVTVQPNDPVVVHVAPPELAAAVYPVIGAPPVDEGAVQVTTASR
jgi:hypothetical protein